MYPGMRLVAGNGWPIRSVQRQSAFTVHPFLPPGYQGLILDKIIVRYLAAAVEAASAYSRSTRSETANDKSRMVWIWKRYLILTHKVRADPSFNEPEGESAVVERFWCQDVQVLVVMKACGNRVTDFGSASGSGLRMSLTISTCVG